MQNNYEQNKDLIEKRFQEIEKNLFEKTGFIQPISLSQFLEQEIQDTEWTVERLIPAGGFTILSGLPGSFKTWIILYIAICVSSGSAVFNVFPAAKSNVLLIDEENSDGLLMKRFNKLGVAKNLPIYLMVKQGFKIDGKKWLNDLLKFIQENEIKLVIFDSLIRIHSADENDARAMARIFDKIKEIEKLNVSVLSTHHHRKQSIFGRNDSSQNLRGSSDILAMADSHISVDKEESELIIKQTKCRFEEEVPPFKVSIKDENGKITFEHSGAYEERKKKVEEAKTAIIELLKENKKLFREDIINRLQGKVGKRNVSDALLELEKEERIISGKEGHKKFYQLKETRK